MKFNKENITFRDRVYLTFLTVSAIQNMCSSYFQTLREEQTRIYIANLISQSEQRMNKSLEVTQDNFNKLLIEFSKKVDKIEDYALNSKEKISAMAEKIASQKELFNTKVEGIKAKTEGIKEAVNMNPQSVNVDSTLNIVGTFLYNNAGKIVLAIVIGGCIGYTYYYWYKPIVATTTYLSSFLGRNDKPRGGGGGDGPSGGSNRPHGDNINQIQSNLQLRSTDATNSNTSVPSAGSNTLSENDINQMLSNLKLHLKDSTNNNTVITHITPNTVETISVSPEETVRLLSRVNTSSVDLNGNNILIIESNPVPNNIPASPEQIMLDSMAPQEQFKYIADTLKADMPEINDIINNLNQYE